MQANTEFSAKDAEALTAYLNNFDRSLINQKIQINNFDNHEMDVIFPIVDRLQAYAAQKGIALEGGYNTAPGNYAARYAYLLHHPEQAKTLAKGRIQAQYDIEKAAIYNKVLSQMKGSEFRDLIKFIREDLNLKI